MQSHTISGIANPPGDTIIHMNREPDSTSTLVGNNSRSLDGTIHTEDTDNAGAPHIDKCSNASVKHLHTLCE